MTLTKVADLHLHFAGNETAVAGNQLAGVQYKVSDYAPENARLIASTSGLKKK